MFAGSTFVKSMAVLSSFESALTIDPPGTQMQKVPLVLMHSALRAGGEGVLCQEKVPLIRRQLQLPCT